VSPNYSNNSNLHDDGLLLDKSRQVNEADSDPLRADLAQRSAETEREETKQSKVFHAVVCTTVCPTESERATGTKEGSKAGKKQNILVQKVLSLGQIQVRNMGRIGV
jgi:hypothetical protein